jgi:hypothetical protein
MECIINCVKIVEIEDVDPEALKIRTRSPSLHEIQVKFVREKRTLQTQMVILTHRLEDSKQRRTVLQAELNEVRHQNEHPEFRILRRRSIGRFVTRPEVESIKQANSFSEHGIIKRTKSNKLHLYGDLISDKFKHF